MLLFSQVTTSAPATLTILIEFFAILLFLINLIKIIRKNLTFITTAIVVLLGNTVQGLANLKGFASSENDARLLYDVEDAEDETP
jgi:hypothetical protein